MKGSISSFHFSFQAIVKADWKPAVESSKSSPELGENRKKSERKIRFVFFILNQYLYIQLLCRIARKCAITMIPNRRFFFRHSTEYETLNNGRSKTLRFIICSNRTLSRSASGIFNLALCSIWFKRKDFQCDEIMLPLFCTVLTFSASKHL